MAAAIDRETREAIRKTVTAAMEDALLTYEERWLTSEQLMEQFGMISKDWLRRNGWRLPRGRFEFKDSDGTVATRWGYPQHRIARMIRENTLMFHRA